MGIVPDKDRYITEINTIPFVGVVFVLMIVFMVAFHPMVCGGETVVLPRTINAIEDEKINKESAIIIAIPDNGVYYVSQKPVTRELLGPTIVELWKKHEINDRNVYIEASTVVQYGSVIDVLSELRNRGINDVGLITVLRPKKTEPKK